MSTRSLPSRPSLDQLKRQARELQRARPELTLAEAQRAVARDYGFSSWADLKQRVEIARDIARIAPHPRFAAALAALDAGDVDRLRDLVAADPTLVHARTHLDPPYGYFTGATLLHHVAGNPGRDQRLPPNVVDLARVLLDAGADVHATTLGPHGGDTMGLLITSKQASDMNVSGPLMELLLERGARLDLTRDDALDLSLANHAPRAAEKMIALGARADLFAAAALGHLDLLRRFFDESGTLVTPPRRGGKELSERDALGLALLYAYVGHQMDAVDFLLEKDGNWDVTWVNNGTALHRAAWAGDLAMVERLIARGADPNNRDNPYGGTPLGWAYHHDQSQVIEWLQQNVAVDLHDAVEYGLLEHVHARLHEAPACVNNTIGESRWTALHVAAWANRAEPATLLLTHGADVDSQTSEGRTALDIADARGSLAVVRVLEAHGGRRSPAAASPVIHPKLKPFDRVASDILDAYRSGNADAIGRLEAFFKRRVTLHEIRSGVRRRLEKGKGTEISVAEARDVVAGLRGFSNWESFAESVTRSDVRASSWKAPLYRIDVSRNRIQVRQGLEDGEWDVILAVIAEQRLESIDASGQMTDRVIAKLAEFEHVSRLDLAGSKALTDAGLQHLARLPRLHRLDLSGCGCSDRGLAVLGHLRELRSFHLYWHAGVTDAGLANLRSCEQLERVELVGTPVGDETIESLTEKVALRHLKTGTRVTDAVLPHLHLFPAFKSWTGGAIRYSLMSPDAEPNQLLLDGPVTGLATLAGLDGLFGLSLFRHTTKLTPDALKALVDLPRLGFVGCEGSLCNDEAMRHLAAIPRLRMLMAQGTVATDVGFASLGRSQTLEYIWGRECPNLTGSGFASLSTLPALRGLAVSCKHVDDEALATLPRFPALNELMPMDVSDDGFRHIGRCENLEALWCMYCRDTTDAATAHIEGLRRLKTYYAGQTKITDRSLEILSRVESLEKLEFWSCAGITNAGARRLAALPHLLEVTFDTCRHVTQEAEAAFPAHVRVQVS